MLGNQTCPVDDSDGPKVSTTTINYINDINRPYTEVLQTTNKNNQTVHTYVYGNERLSDAKRGESTNYYAYDGKGSVVGQETVNNKVALSFKVSYNDFGQANRKMDNQYGYNGQSHDYNGSQYLRARYYDTKTGTFGQQDSYLGESEKPISQNRYVYTWSNAINNIDPDGHYPRSIKPPKTVSTDNYRPTSQPPGGYIPPKKPATNVGLSGNGQALENYYTGLGYMVGTGSYVSENNARVTAEREAGNALAAAQTTKNNLVSYIEGTIGGMIDYDYLNSMSLQDQLRYLNELKKLCDLYNQEKLSAAQALIKAKGFVPDVNLTYYTRYEMMISQLQSGVVPNFAYLDDMMAYMHSTAGLAYYASANSLMMLGPCGEVFQPNWGDIAAIAFIEGTAGLLIFAASVSTGGSGLVPATLFLSTTATGIITSLQLTASPVYATDGTIMCSDTGSSSSSGMELGDSSSFEGKNYNDIEDFLDSELRDNQGWTKDSLTKGDGVRYYNGKGSSYQLNKGYGANNWGDGLHEGPYLKITGYGPTIRIQIKP